MQQGENRKGKNNNTKKKNQYLMFIQVFTGEDLGFGNLRFVTIKWWLSQNLQQILTLVEVPHTCLGIQAKQTTKNYN